MEALPFVERVLDDESLTEGLQEVEAEILLGWLVAAVEEAAERADGEEDVTERVAELMHMSGLMARFVRAWCYDEDADEATRLAREAASLTGEGSGGVPPWMEATVEIAERAAEKQRPRSDYVAELMQAVIDARGGVCLARS